MQLPRILVFPAIALVAWQAVAQTRVFDPFLFPTAFAVLEKLFELVASGAILPDLASTLAKLGLSLAIGSVLGVMLGLLLARWEFAFESLSPAADFVRGIPGTALFPLFMLFFGVGDVTTVALAAWVCVFYLSLPVCRGLRATNPALIAVAKSLKKTDLEILLQVRALDALPRVFTGFRIAASLTLVVVMLADMFLGAQAGLGKALIDAAYTYDVAKLYAVIIVVGVIGYSLNRGIAVVEKKVVHWK
ncbi:TPA: ABC transporter permease subunit [Candidatus Micrarchaeota archaeon]|nr:ABC transporter permease subunit [Candidatus Micrarchaeota archaeon]